MRVTASLIHGQYFGDDGQHDHTLQCRQAAHLYSVSLEVVGSGWQSQQAVVLDAWVVA